MNVRLLQFMGPDDARVTCTIVLEKHYYSIPRSVITSHSSEPEYEYREASELHNDRMQAAMIELANDSNSMYLVGTIASNSMSSCIEPLRQFHHYGQATRVTITEPPRFDEPGLITLFRSYNSRSHTANMLLLRIIKPKRYIMIKPITLVLLAAFASSSLAAISTSLLARRAVAAEVPPEESQLKQDPQCFQVSHDNSPDDSIPCDLVACSGNFCCDDYMSCFIEARSSCQNYFGFEVLNPNQNNCDWQYSCCTFS